MTVGRATATSTTEKGKPIRKPILYGFIFYTPEDSVKRFRHHCLALVSSHFFVNLPTLSNLSFARKSFFLLVAPPRAPHPGPAGHFRDGGETKGSNCSKLNPISSSATIIGLLA